MRTFLENFSCTNLNTLTEVINKHAARVKLEILSISVVYEVNAKYKYKAVVLFEKQIVVSASNGGLGCNLVN